ncbi:MAG: glycine--tRNA ligase subunit beta [Negativicutes bacterium]|nr:glycine--tRNA ligase subunit beta [Negativicutes bacterium]
MAKDLLLEIGTEEIPAKFMPGILSQMETLAQERFAGERIGFSEIKAMGTPRRIVLVVRDVADVQQDKISENRGPSVKVAFDAEGKPTKAAEGFARGQGIVASELIVRDGYVYAVIHQTGRPVAEILPQILPDLIASLNFPKSMRWGDLDMRFVRPIRWLVALLGSDVIPFSLAGIAAGNVTRGHRFLSRGDIVVKDANDYFAKLAEHHVMVDPEVRRSVIREQVEKLAQRQGGEAGIDEELLEEVTYLVEYPTALCGRFEEAYLELPPQAIITPMREHQRYFPVWGADGKLLPLFITVRNGGLDYIDIVRHGNERVLRARLADARFFFNEDQKTPLAERVEKLKTMVFQEGLGTLFDKTLRLKRLAVEIAKSAGIDAAEHPVIERGAFLAKADLVTGMVYEFTELQGIMGRQYALLNGENPAVAEAIYEHYLPRFAGDTLPETHAGRVISIADKLDNIVATFSRGLIPTGSQDPYALRRQALGVAYILINAKYHISLAKLTADTMDLLGISDPGHREKITADIIEFFKLRLKNILTDENLRYDMIDAVMAAGVDDLYDAWLRGQALLLDGGTIAMQRAVQALTRAGNLAKNASREKIDPALFTTDAERDLYHVYLAAKDRIDSLTAAREYRGVLEVMAGLATPIDAFFSTVMVMVEDLAVRENRLALLKAITGLTSRIADFSKIVAV